MSTTPGEGGALVRASGEDALIQLACRPGRPRTRLCGIRAGAFLVDLEAPPEGGAANAELLSFLAKLLGLPRGSLRITSGFSTRRKSVRVAGKDPKTVLSALRPLLPKEP